MHIVQLANFYGDRSGGLRTALDALARCYADAGHRRTLVVPGDADEIVEDDAGRVVRVRSPRMPGLGGYRVITRRNEVDRVIDLDPPDVIELSDKSTLVACGRRARRRGIPVVLISHERLDAVWAAATGRRPATRTLDGYNRRLSASVDAIVCASRFAAAEFGAAGSPPVVHIPLGVDSDRFRPVSFGPSQRSVRRLEIVSAVRLSADKRPGIIVETSRELTRRQVDHRVTVLGHGPMRDELERRAAGLPVTFAGFVADREELRLTMACADVGIAPGPAETFGLAALEMMACGTPVVVPDVGALREVIGDGGIVASRTPAAFADATLLIAGDLEAMSMRARAHAGTFTWRRTSDALIGLYTDLGTRTGVTAVRSLARTCSPARGS